MITPDVKRLAEEAQAKGTPEAVFEFLCRTRHHFTLAQFAAECPKLGVDRPDFMRVLSVMKSNANLHTFDRPANRVRSKVAGQVCDG
jgi:hypothetical protein